jgi:uncharacterized membrane protein
MTLKIFELVSIICSASVGGMYWGPWLALTKSMKTFKPDVFLVIVDRLNRNMAGLMTALTPIALLSIVPVLFISFERQPTTFYLSLAGFISFVVALLVTVIVEVPIVKQIATWTTETLPDTWTQLPDRWGAFHIIRVVAGIVGLALLVAGAIF